MKFNLAKYIIPSVISMVLIGTYTTIDGLFIGDASGDAGLAAVNFAWPIVAFITSVGTGIGVGGAIVINHLRGKEEIAAAETAKCAALKLLVIAGVVVTMLTILTYSPLLIVMGAKVETLVYAQEYSRVISFGALFQIMGSGLLVLLRNEGKTVRAMLYTVVGLAVHIALDALLVQRYILRGVAISTVISQLVVAVLCAASFRLPRKEDALKTSGADILSSSLAPFGLNFVPSAVLLFTNYFAMRSGGTEMVSAYAVMSYAVYFYDYLCQGVCDGIQPVVSYTHGARDSLQKKKTLFTAALVLAVASCGFVALTPVLVNNMPKIFSVSTETENYIRRGFVIYAASYPLKAMVKLVCAYYYSIKKLWVSNILTYLDPLLFTPLSLMLASSFAWQDGIWLSLPLSQAAVMVVFLPIFMMQRRNQI